MVAGLLMHLPSISDLGMNESLRLEKVICMVTGNFPKHLLVSKPSTQVSITQQKMFSIYSL